MIAQEVMQHVQIRLHFLKIAAGLGPTNVIDDHVANLICAVLAMQQVLGERGGGYFRNVLMLGDCPNFLLAQAAECDAVVHADHDTHLNVQAILHPVRPP